MKVDRERFLLLAAALTAGVCAAPACGGAPGAPTLPAPQPSAEPLVVPPMPVGYATAPSAEVEPPPPPVAASPPNPYDGTPVRGQTCAASENKVGHPGVCHLTAPPGPTCESIDDTKAECPSLAALLKPRVAEAAIACLRRRSGTKEICQFNVTSICAYEALASVCVEPHAKRACDGVLKACGAAATKMSRDSCEAGVSAIVDGRRARFISCITESCAFESCLTYL